MRPLCRWQSCLKVMVVGFLSVFVLSACGGSTPSGSPDPGGSGSGPSTGDGDGPTNVVVGGPGRIAYLRQSSQTGSFHLHVVNPDGSNAVNPIPIDDLADYSGHSWSPDGSQIAFASNRSGNANFNIYVMNADGTNIRSVVEDSGGDFVSAWSPDGQKMLFQAQRSNETLWDIYVVNIDGSGEQVLVNTPLIEELASWSPDGAKVVYQARAQGGTGSDIYVVNADGTGVTRLTDGNGSLHSGPAWSPDGTQIAFESNRHQPPATDGAPARAQYEIYLMNSDGSNIRQLTFSNPFSEATRFPTWSPDGKQLAFEFHNFDSNAIGAASIIVVLNVDGSNVYSIPNVPIGSIFPRWSPIP